MVAITFANIAMDLIADGVPGQMVAIHQGQYTNVPVPAPSMPKRRVDIANNYNVERFRPRYDGRMGEPLLLMGSPSIEAAT